MQLAISCLWTEEVLALCCRDVEQSFALSPFSHLGMSLRRLALSLLTAFTILTPHLSVFQPGADSALWRYNGVLPLGITSVDAESQYFVLNSAAVCFLGALRVYRLEDLSLMRAQWLSSVCARVCEGRL